MDITSTPCALLPPDTPRSLVSLHPYYPPFSLKRKPFAHSTVLVACAFIQSVKQKKNNRADRGGMSPRKKWQEANRTLNSSVCGGGWPSAAAPLALRDIDILSWDS